ncbi:MAG TPA: ribosomal L7Ae/L30e/S12e/Gadd45 family protein [Clostridiales bacterium]|nr:ribosomal L7Ae/L30e/S12e/Gadd45 family protein [Clostridiales bacterium]HPV00982.1 ribosomal L7Ae/L30e/S12e/Gadd45 family protein [Clostridiales bacterium]
MTDNRMTDNRIYSFLGLATKAGKLISGDDTCERTVRKGKVRLVIVAEDASENTRKKFEDICSYRNIAMRFFGKKEKLGRYIGKSMRSVVAVIDGNFSKRLLEMIDNHGKEYGGV